jgi:hypothetical protein
MSAADQLRYNTSLFAPLLLQGPSMWGHSSWARCANYIDRRVDLTPIEADNYSDWSELTLTFVPPKIADRLGEAQLIAQFSAMSGTPGTFFAVVEALGYAYWSQFLVVNGQNTLQTYKSEDAYDKYASEHCTEERDVMAYLTKSELSLVQRQALAATTFKTFTEMPFYWTETLDRNLCLFQQALESRIQITLKPYARIFETDYTALHATISGLRLRVLYTHTQAKERDDLTTDVRTGMGLVWKIDDIQRQNITVNANETQSISYPIDSITGDVKTLVLMRRVKSEIDGTTALNRPFSNLLEIPRLRITAAGDEILSWVEGDYVLYHLHKFHGYPSPAGKRIYRINFQRYAMGGPNGFSGLRYFGKFFYCKSSQSPMSSL